MGINRKISEIKNVLKKDFNLNLVYISIKLFLIGRYFMFLLILTTLIVTVILLLVYIFLCVYFIELRYKSLASKIWKNYEYEYKYIITKDNSRSKEYKIKKVKS